MSDVISAFLRCEQGQRDRHEFDDLIETPGPNGAQKRFQFRERLFDGVEVGTVRRQETQVCARPFDRRTDVRVLVHGEVVQDDDIPWPQPWHEHLLDVGEEARVVDRAVEHRRRIDAIRAQRRDDRLGLPVTAGGVIVEPRAARTLSVSPQ